MKNKLVIVFIAFLICGLPSIAATKTSTKKAAPKPKAAVTQPTEWAATVNDDTISMDLYNKRFEAAKKQITKEISLEAAEEKGLIKETRKAVLEQMIEAVILMQWAQREGIEIKDTTIKAKVQALKKTFPSSKEFHKSLAEQGKSIPDLEMDLKKQIIVDKLISMRAKAIAVSDEEIQAFYDKNSDLYQQSPKAHLLQMLFKNSSDAEEQLKTLESNGAKEFDGDDIGLVEKGQLPVYDDSGIFTLKSGEISGIASGEGGYYIYKVEDVMPAKDTKFKDVRESIRRFLLGEKARTQYLKDLRQEKTDAKIIINQDLEKLFQSIIIVQEA